MTREDTLFGFFLLGLLVVLSSVEGPWYWLLATSVMIAVIAFLLGQEHEANKRKRSAPIATTYRTRKRDTDE